MSEHEGRADQILVIEGQEVGTRTALLKTAVAEH